jgi:2,4-dienoyl-CoA reductase-like NADH-dependent reductase (Old Yellow Enzyme family)
MEYKIIDIIKDLERLSPRNSEESINNTSKYIKENLEKVGIDYVHVSTGDSRESTEATQ